MSTAPIPAPSSGGSALKVILIVLAVIAAIVIGGFGLVAYGCYHVAHSIMHKDGEKATISIPGAGSITTNHAKTFSASELGADIYPGAKPAEEGSSSISLPTGSITTGAFTTPDPVSNVQAFYKDKFGKDASDFGTSHTAMISKKISENESVTVTVSSKADENDGKTRLVIIHTTKKGN